ncbi:MAG: anaerobic magnesium-protoporphyrin IX monomethyl ester cyclase [Planctomycetota bacterium]|jgi:anaerobic magnesium-protoporphyrin IX monomethyl ester cyclase
MTRIVFVQTYHPYTQHTHVHPLGIMAVAAAVREGGFDDIHILDMKAENWTAEKALEALKELKPDVVGLSAMTYEAGCLHKLARLIKSDIPGAVTVAGGPHPSVADDDVMKDEAVDFCVRGEGEEIFLDLVQGIAVLRSDWDGCTGITWRNSDGDVVREPDRSPPDDLDELPMPAWDLIDHPKYHNMPRGGLIYAHKEFATMFSSRACPWRCTYCHNSYGKKFRARSAENVLAEIDYLVKNHGVKELVFMDDIFNLRPERAAAIARGLIERNYGLKMTFPNGLRGDILKEDLVLLLKEAGMYRCMVAVESSSARIQKVMKKNLKIDKVKHIVEFIAKQGVLVHGAFMLGFPTETEEEMEATIDWAADSAFHTAAFFRVIPFKGTQLFEEVEQAGFELPSNWEAYEPYQTDINLSEAPETKITAIRNRAYRKFYFKPSRLWQIFKLIPNKVSMLPYLTVLFAQRAYSR